MFVFVSLCGVLLSYILDISHARMSVMACLFSPWNLSMKGIIFWLNKFLSRVVFFPCLKLILIKSTGCTKDIHSCFIWTCKR